VLGIVVTELIIFAVMERTAMMRLISMLDEHIELHREKAGKLDIGAMIAKNYALRLLDEEKTQLENAFDAGLIGDEFSSYEYYLKKFGNDNKGRS
jgi:hypothetical protein